MTKFIEYAKELGPKIRQLNDLKESLKEFKETDERSIEYQETIKEEQDWFKVHLETHEDSSVIVAAIKELTIELKEGFSAAAKDTQFKAAEVGAYLSARAKEEAVAKTILKGNTFMSLEDLLEEA